MRNILTMQYLTNPINLQIGANIRDSRLMRNYSQDYLALRLHISQNAYSKIELGYTRVTLERIFFISSILDVDVNNLLAIKEACEFDFGSQKKVAL
jgi:transcriptional regulator with XRE-family HTH domain